MSADILDRQSVSGGIQMQKTQRSPRSTYRRRASVARLLGFALLLIGVSAAASDPLASVELPNRQQPAPHLLTGGQPTGAQLQAAAQAGVRHIINLRPEYEQPGVNEQALVESLGMRYYHLPVAGLGDLTPEAAEQLDRILSDIGEEPALMHCASGNRVGALMALRAHWLQGKPPDAALADGRAAGMTGLEPIVCGLLDASC
jgi:uncharacterized protein (TIGR01244 family)